MLQTTAKFVYILPHICKGNLLKHQKFVNLIFNNKYIWDGINKLEKLLNKAVAYCNCPFELIIDGKMYADQEAKIC